MAATRGCGRQGRAFGPRLRRAPGGAPLTAFSARGEPGHAPQPPQEPPHEPSPRERGQPMTDLLNNPTTTGIATGAALGAFAGGSYAMLTGHDEDIERYV